MIRATISRVGLALLGFQNFVLCLGLAVGLGAATSILFPARFTTTVVVYFVLLLLVKTYWFIGFKGLSLA